MSSPIPTTTIIKTDKYQIEHCPLGDVGTAMHTQSMLVFRKPTDTKHLPTMTQTVPTEIAKWLEELLAENARLKKMAW